MKTATILVVVFFAMRAASQDVIHSPAHAQCRFPDGTSIVVGDFHFLFDSRAGLPRGHQWFRLSTNGPLLTTHGISVPAGDYDAYFEKNSHQHWTLSIRKPFGREGLLFMLSLPMSVTSFALSSESPEISFDQTGGSCMMIWSHKQSDTVLSLEFTQKNADMPVLQ
jgi:hypothetical protein